MFPTLACFFFVNSNEIYATKITVPGMDFEVEARDIFIGFAFITGIHFNLENIYVGIRRAENKLYALGCLLPYA